MSQPATLGAPASRLACDHSLIGGPPSPRMPTLVYGTAWKGDRTADLVYTALRVGFRGLDSAAHPKHYDEPGAGEGVRRAVAEGLVRREHLFIQTKFTPLDGQSHSIPFDADAPLADQVRQSVQSSLDSFTLDGQEPYLDCVVLHLPMNTMEDTLTVWESLESYVPRRVRSLGISNATVAIVEDLWRDPTTVVKPAVVQNPFFVRTCFAGAVRAFCRQTGVVFQSFWTRTANASLARSSPVVHVARLAGVEPTAAYYSLVLGLGIVTVLDGTTSEAHMRDNLGGIEKVGLWAEGGGSADWESLLEVFKTMVRDL